MVMVIVLVIANKNKIKQLHQSINQSIQDKGSL